MCSSLHLLPHAHCCCCCCCSRCLTLLSCICLCCHLLLLLVLLSTLLLAAAAFVLVINEKVLSHDCLIENVNRGRCLCCLACVCYCWSAWACLEAGDLKPAASQWRYWRSLSRISDMSCLMKMSSATPKAMTYNSASADNWRMVSCFSMTSTLDVLTDGLGCTFLCLLSPTELVTMKKDRDVQLDGSSSQGLPGRKHT